MKVSRSRIWTLGAAFGALASLLLVHLYLIMVEQHAEDTNYDADERSDRQPPHSAQRPSIFRPCASCSYTKGAAWSADGFMPGMPWRGKVWLSSHLRAIGFTGAGVSTIPGEPC